MGVVSKVSDSNFEAEVLKSNCNDGDNHQKGDDAGGGCRHLEAAEQDPVADHLVVPVRQQKSTDEAKQTEKGTYQTPAEGQHHGDENYKNQYPIEWVEICEVHREAPDACSSVGKSC